MHRVYVTRRIPGNALGHLSAMFPTLIHSRHAPPSKNVILKNIKGKSALLCMLSDKIDRQVIQTAGESLKIISTYSTGIDHIDVNEATSRGIYVTYTSDILTESTADLAFSLILAGCRNIISGDSLVRSGRWRVGWQPDLLLGFDVHGATLGLVGLGRIGQAVARRAKGFSMNVIYCSKTRKPEAESELGIRFRELDDLLAESDIVSVHTDSNDTTTHLLNARRLTLMKKSATLVNTARGNVVDTDALVSSLKSNKIAGACLDVFEVEPLPSSSALCRMQNVLLTPHIGSATHFTREKMAQVAVDSIIAVLSGKKPQEKFVVNKKLLG